MNARNTLLQAMGEQRTVLDHGEIDFDVWLEDVKELMRHDASMSFRIAVLATEPGSEDAIELEEEGGE